MRPRVVPSDLGYHDADDWLRADATATTVDPRPALPLSELESRGRPATDDASRFSGFSVVAALARPRSR